MATMPMVEPAVTDRAVMAVMVKVVMMAAVVTVDQVATAEMVEWATVALLQDAETTTHTVANAAARLEGPLTSWVALEITLRLPTAR